MDRQEIIKLFLSNGFQLSQNTLPFIERDPEKTLSDIKKIKPRPFIITNKILEKISKSGEGGRINKIMLSKKKLFEKEELSINDYTKHFNEVYEKIKEILLKNTKLTKLISVNKIANITMEFSLIVLVRDKGLNNLLIEDSTGETHVFFDENLREEFDSVEVDDVLGIMCKKNEEKIFVNNIIYPGTSITRKINKTTSEIKIFYVYKPTLLDKKNIEKLNDILRKNKKTYPIFVFGGWNDKEILKGFESLFLVSEGSIPMLFEIEDVKILGLPETDSLENIVNKRMIKGDSLLNTTVIEDTPDIILSSGTKTYSKNYKGTTIISNKDQNRYFIVNLKTRELEEKTI